jgi:hypothetical protein
MMEGKPHGRPTSVDEFEAREVGAKFSASQTIEIARNRERISEASRGAAATIDELRTAEEPKGGKFSTWHPLEIAQSRERIAIAEMSSPLFSPREDGAGRSR